MLLYFLCIFPIAPKQQGACVWYPAGVEIFNDRFEQIIVEVVALISRFSGEESGKRYEHLIQKWAISNPQKLIAKYFLLV